MYKCSAGQCTYEADHKHPKLDVPLCGKCHKSSQEALIHNTNNTSKQPIVGINEKDDDNCIWCGNSDGYELFMCDTCTAVYCEKCCFKNFGEIILNEIKVADPWSCFACHPTEYFKKVRLPTGSILLNLDDVYMKIKPPDAAATSLELTQLRATLTSYELNFASIFTDIATNTPLAHLQIYDYLSVFDFMKIYVLNSRLRLFFHQYSNTPIPALFKTSFGVDNNCYLHKHQISSLINMKKLENAQTKYGSLRGGIFGDEPGLGKTVTTLALILTSAGTMPKQPEIFWNTSNLQNSWSLLRSTGCALNEMLLPVVNEIERGMGHVNDDIQTLRIRYFRGKGNGLPEYLSTFEQEVRDVIRRQRDVSCLIKESVLETFRMNMNRIRSRLDKSERSSLSSSQGKRVLFERSIRPSAATLIVVPLALLEHWYEQIVRHMGLNYLSRLSREEEEDYDEMLDDDGDMDSEERLAKKMAFRLRGVVYLDGIGDIADVQAPLSKLQVSSNMTVPPEKLAHYLIVITTFERCSQQFSQYSRLADVSKKSFIATSSSRNRDKDSLQMDCYSSIPLLQIRWLRLVVDEGHELGGGEVPSDATLFISEIAAERRWVMSGTPTSAITSRAGLRQLQRLLQFLRHGEYGIGAYGLDIWKKRIQDGFVMHNIAAFYSLVDLLRVLMVRHQKSDIHLYAPQYTNIVLDQVVDNADVGMVDELARRVDRAVANFVMDELSSMKTLHRDYLRRSTSRTYRQDSSFSRLSSASIQSPSKESVASMNAHRRPKFIMFSENHDRLQAVAHFLYLGLGDQSICEHFGIFRSTELSRFRHSKRTYRMCPLCGHKNGAHVTNGCEKVLLRVAYDPAVSDTPISPSASGHSANGPGGHFMTPCLCNISGMHVCSGYPNALFNCPSDNAIIAEEHVTGFESGRKWHVGERVFVASASAYCSSLADNGGCHLWKDGRMGGWATILEWKRCGGKQPSWHGSGIFPHLSWKAEAEDASILLLCADGSHGLDLSFVTNIFLLERLKDKALEEQIISRANRMGATGTVYNIFAYESKALLKFLVGPVKVTTVFVRAAEGEVVENDAQ